MALDERIARREGGLLLFSVTPPRAASDPDEAQRIADVTIERLSSLEIDGLVLYDVDDESDRNSGERPFPYLPTMDPATFHARHLGEWDRPVVVYRCVGKYDESALIEWLAAQDEHRVLSVFVGASSSSKEVRTDLARAQSLWREIRPALLLGGVAIPERHTRRGDEFMRMVRKQDAGCSYFVTQVVYDADAAKSLVSDYHYACRDRGVEPAPVVFTLSVCGSVKTLEFLEWLGVDVPRWLRNDLVRAGDQLSTSYDHCVATARELAAFCRRLGMPFGFNVESVSNRRVEIDASVRLAAYVCEHVLNAD